MGVGMKHLNENQSSKFDISRATSSCDSDVDRQELISNYASEKYLSKWSLDLEEDGGPRIEVEVTVTPKPPEDKSPPKQEESSKHNGLASIVAEEDDTSLVSYNSVRDGTPTATESATPKPDIPPSYLPYQLANPPNLTISMWQGYSGNIYFDPVRCQSMRINSSKTRKNTKKKTFHRKTKSCSPAIETYRTATSSTPVITSGYNSHHGLGSLRFTAHDRRRAKHFAEKTHSSHSGQILKGFSENNLREANYEFPKHTRSESAPDSLVIAGDQVGDGGVDPIDNVHKHNMKSRLSSKSKDSEVYGDGSFPSLILGKKIWSLKKNKEDLERFYRQNLRFPGLGNSMGTSETASTSSRDLTEPKPVFIIPFGSFDDPVENAAKSKSKRSSQKTPFIGNLEEKESVNIPSESTNTKKISQVAYVNGNDVNGNIETDSKIPDNQEATKSENTEDSKNESRGSLQSSQGRITNQVERRVELTKNSSHSLDLNVRRQISNSSLSNYLRTVPNKIIKTKSGTPSTKTVPKLSYTQRRSDATGVYLMDNYDYSDYSMKTPRTSALCGGYLPSTGRQQSKGFYAEIVTDDVTEDTDSVTIRESVISDVESRTSGPQDRNQSPKRSILKTGLPSKKDAQMKLSGSSKQAGNASCKLPVIGKHVLKSEKS